MSKLSVIGSSRRALSSVLWIAVATFVVMGLSAVTASAQDHKVTICHKGQALEVDVHAVSAHLEHGDRLSCDTGGTCPCSQEFNPVICGGTLYANACLAACAGETPPCPAIGVCSNIYNPVVCDGITYANECQARLSGCTGAITVNCPCGTDYNPVRCGNRTYVNACAAACDGQTGCTPVN